MCWSPARPRRPAPRAVQLWLRGVKGDLTLSDWTLTEVASALSLKVRTGELSRDDRDTAAAAVASIVENMPVVAVERTHFAAAARLAGSPDARLRAGDALHLAICLDRKDTLVTLDTRLAHAARAEQVNVIEP